MQCFQNTDSCRFNIAHLPGKSLTELYEICMQIPFAVGFNSRGWLKYRISENKTPAEGVDLYVLDKQSVQLKSVSVSPIWCINLERRRDRKEIMRCSGLDINFFEAIDGQKLSMTDELQHLFRNNDFHFRRGVVGAALSHYYLWKQLLNSEERTYLIVEDDVEFCDNFMDKYSHAMAQMESLDPYWDFLYLGFSLYDRESVKDDLWNDNFPITTPFDYNLCFGAGFFGYVISRGGAQKMVDYIEQNGIGRAIDCLPPLMPNVSKYSTNPNLIQTPCFSSILPNVDTDIQKDYSTL